MPQYLNLQKNMLEIHCLHHNNENYKNGRLMLSPKCAVCGSKKSRFMEE